MFFPFLAADQTLIGRLVARPRIRAIGRADFRQTFASTLANSAENFRRRIVVALAPRFLKWKRISTEISKARCRRDEAFVRSRD